MWTQEDHRRAVQEGWALFETTRGREIQRLDNPCMVDGLNYSEPLFDGDIAAFRFVVERAEAGSDLHLRALALDPMVKAILAQEST
jgi:hypothetical protein